MRWGNGVDIGIGFPTGIDEEVVAVTRHFSVDKLANLNGQPHWPVDPGLEWQEMRPATGR